MYSPILSKWAEKWWPTESTISPPISIVLNLLYAPKVPLQPVKRKELSALEWTNLIIIATGSAP